MTYTVKEFGQVTRFEAGVWYKAMKNGNIEMLPETTKMMYNEADQYIRFASQRYSQNHVFYDRIYDATRAMLDEDWGKAQEIVNKIQNDCIRLAGKKSPFFKYQNQ